MRWQIGDQKSFEHRFTQEQVEAYAKLVGDHNPMHVDADFARKATGDAPVVHGMFAASFVSTLVGMHLPGPGALWQSFQVSWRKPIRAGDLIRFQATVASTHPSTQTIELDIRGVHVDSGDICLEGKGRVMIVETENIEKTEETALADRTFIVTGATGELGGAICTALAEQGVNRIDYGPLFDKVTVEFDQQRPVANHAGAGPR